MLSRTKLAALPGAAALLLLGLSAAAVNKALAAAQPEIQWLTVEAVSSIEPNDDEDDLPDLLNPHLLFRPHPDVVYKMSLQ